MAEHEKPLSDLSKTAAYYDELSSRYDATYDDPISSAENIFVKESLVPILGERVLDVGSGTGLLLDLFSPQFYAGLELSSGMISKAQEKYPERLFIRGDMHKLPFNDESFDTIVCLFGTYSYSLTPHDLLRELLRVLEPDGKVAIMPSTLRMRKRIKEGSSHSTTPTEEAEKLYYNQELVEAVFGRLENVKVRGINFFANSFDEIREAMQQEQKDTDFYLQTLRLEEIYQELIPVDYARHMLITGEK